MSAAQVACQIAARAMVEELRVSRALGVPWREAMNSSYRVLDEILEMAGNVPPIYPEFPDGWWVSP